MLSVGEVVVLAVMLDTTIVKAVRYTLTTLLQSYNYILKIILF
jgi:hypothetical protein